MMDPNLFRSDMPEALSARADALVASAMQTYRQAEMGLTAEDYGALRDVGDRRLQWALAIDQEWAA